MLSALASSCAAVSISGLWKAPLTRKGNRPAFLFLNERKGRFHRRLGPADDELGRGVVVGHNEDFSRGFRSGLGDFVHGFAVELKDCRHAALAVRIGVRHQLPAQAYQFKGRFRG